MFLMIFLSIFFVLRSLAAVFSTFGVILLTIGATFGSVGLLGNVLNQMVITYPVLIITLALADCVHLFAIYFQERNKGETSKESMIKSLELNLQPLFLTTVNGSRYDTDPPQVEQIGKRLEKKEVNIRAEKVVSPTH